MREEFFISRSTAADESKLREEDVLSVTSSDPVGSALLAHAELMKAERIFLSLLSLSVSAISSAEYSQNSSRLESRYAETSTRKSSSTWIECC